MNDYLHELMRKKPAAKKPSYTLDGTGKDDAGNTDAAAKYAADNFSVRAISTLQQWVETDDLDRGETYADRLMAMVVGLTDENKDGKITGAEQDSINYFLERIWDYISRYGVKDDDISALLNDLDDDAAERIRDLLARSLPEGKEADADMFNFVFGDDKTPALDAAYKKVVAVRDGKKKVVHKRVADYISLSAKQKAAIKKAGLKSHTATAEMHRDKSNRMRDKIGL